MLGILEKIGIVTKEKGPEENLIHDEEDIIASAFTRKNYFIKASPTGASDEEIHKIVEALIEYDPVMIITFTNIPDDKKSTFAAQLKSAIVNIPDRNFRAYYLSESHDNIIIVVLPEDYEVVKI